MEPIAVMVCVQLPECPFNPKFIIMMGSVVHYKNNSSLQPIINPGMLRENFEQEVSTDREVFIYKATDIKERDVLTLRGKHMVEVPPHIIPASPVVHYHGGTVGLMSTKQTHTITITLS